MLQSAIWKLGRKQRLLLPLARPLQSQHRDYNHSKSYSKSGTDGWKTEESCLDYWSSTTSETSEPKCTTPMSKNSLHKDTAIFPLGPTPSSEDAFAAKFANARRIHHDSEAQGARRFNDIDGGTDAVLRREQSRLSSLYLDDGLSPDKDRSTWLESRLHLRPSELKSQLSKSWANCGPEVLYHKVLYPGEDQYMWWERVASLRSFRLPVVVLQMSIRQTILTAHQDKRHILDLLPKGRNRRNVVEILGGNGYSRDEISAYVHIIQGRSDHESCQRFLEYPGHKPIFLLRHLLRPNSELSDIFILHELIQYVSNTYDGLKGWRRDEIFPGPGKRDFRRAQNPMLNMDPKLFGSTLGLLTQRCLEVETRLCLHVVDVAIQYILNISSWDQHPEKTFYDQCMVFNEALAALSPRKAVATKIYRSFPHIWEAQRKLLTMSAGLKRPLLLDRRGFFAVRTVLAGQQKNNVECHSSRRHAQSWPPYLEPGDGMDEMTDPEENWSRSVQAGALAQEAGFDKTEVDDSLDILQGRAPDGTPTIQQWITVLPRRLTPWVASIKATRNAQEAWGRFQSPPEKKMRPGVEEYEAMFTKLLQPDARPELNLYPGDKPFSFPTKTDVNLSEFGRARLRPPTVSTLYAEMLRQGVRPRRGCLNILVWHSESLELAHSYLQDSQIDFSVLMDTSVNNDIDSLKLRRVNISLFAAYINVLCREDPANNKPLQKAIFLCKKRFEVDHHNRSRAPQLWGMIMKAITEPWHRRERPLHDQLSLFNQLLGFIQASTFLPLSTYLQFCKSLRKTVGREMDNIISDLEAGRQSTMATLYNTSSWDCRSPEYQELGRKSTDRHHKAKIGLHSINLGVVRMKQLFKDMVRREDTGRKILRAHRIDSIDQILARRDPVRAEDAHDHVLTLAFVGEFEEMANVLAWLVREWSDPDLCDALYDCEQIPSIADFNDVLCAFRLLAEPMLEIERVAQLRQTIEQANAGWIWPDNETVLWYRDMQASEATKKLSHVLEWTRYRQRQPGLEAEFDHELERPEAWVEPKKETPPEQRVWMGIRPQPENRYAKRYAF